MNSVMIGLIPMAGTMTSFGAIKSAIQMTKNCTDDPEPSNVLNVTAGNIFYSKFISRYEFACFSE